MRTIALHISNIHIPAVSHTVVPLNEQPKTTQDPPHKKEQKTKIKHWNYAWKRPEKRGTIQSFNLNRLQIKRTHKKSQISSTVQFSQPMTTF